MDTEIGTPKYIKCVPEAKIMIIQQKCHLLILSGGPHFVEGRGPRLFAPSPINPSLRTPLICTES